MPCDVATCQQQAREARGPARGPERYAADDDPEAVQSPTLRQALRGVASCNV
ncbi:hypothetical protein PYCCODRAFT_1440901 [Trametes coccinea BRFM310]|uniref:Uncharacterized protein n=1 Tax=Trametes coccinea (strain BRFM310) TaxID=1353009 RepID=A0A1Y2I7L2_TRAC3|nr:hypothetical protein PYCCODRAFT_1440901 [Trametes coccinea BRFM310]